MSSGFSFGPGGGSGSSSSSFSFGPGSGGGSTHSSGHSIFHNLLGDLVDTAKGIVPGIVTSVQHPIKAADAIGHSYSTMYSPLIHGQFGKFWGNFHSHPLGPLLDALSVVTLGAGTVGRAARGLETVGMLQPGAADFARAGSESLTRDLPTRLGGGLRHGEIAVHYSPNLATHGLQVAGEKVMQGLGKLPVGKQLVGPGGLHDMTDAGRGARLLAQRASMHGAGTRLQMGRQISGVKNLLKDQSLSSADVRNYLHEGIVNSVFAHSLKVPADAAQGLKGAEWAYVKKVRPLAGLPEGSSLQDWATHVKDHNPFMTTRDPAKALKNADGTLNIIHAKLPSMATDEASKGLRVLHAMYTAPTKLWKYMVLAQAPRYFVNNTLGNAFMLAASTRPDKLARGLYQAVKDVHGEKAALKMAHHTEGTLGREVQRLSGGLYDKWYGGTQTGPFTELHHLTRKSEPGVAAKIPNPIAEGLYRPTEKVAYRGTHRIGVNVAMRETKQFQDLYRAERATGVRRDVAYRHAFDKASADPAVRGYVNKRTADWAGQYYHSTPLENALRVVVPFYSWDRHALRFAKSQMLTRPTATDALIHTGANGNQYTQEKLGKVPDFILGAVPIGDHHGGLLGDILGQAKQGRKSILLTNSLNPLSAAGEDVNALAALAGQQVGTKSDALGFQVNPLIAGAINSITGTRLGSGSKVHYKGGVVGGAATEAFGNTPALKMVQALIHPQSNVTSKGKPTLYSHDLRTQILSTLGIPQREYSPQAGQIMIAKGQRSGGTKKKKAFTYG